MVTKKSVEAFFRLVAVALLLATTAGRQATSQEAEFPPLAALGPPPIPADNAQDVDENGYPSKDDPKVSLGKLLFFDNRLSGDASISCADCHDPQFGWTDGSDICRGYAGTVHWRNCQSIVNSVYYAKFFWAGSSKSRRPDRPSACCCGSKEVHSSPGLPHTCCRATSPRGFVVEASPTRCSRSRSKSSCAFVDCNTSPTPEPPKAASRGASPRTRKK